MAGSIHYFISDVHLGIGERDQERRREDFLLGFLEAVRPSAATLCIVGDLFDFWFEYGTVIPKGFHRTLTAIQRYPECGIPVHFLTGNHDYWMLDFFQKELGVTIHREPVELVLGGKRILLHHGDGLALNDIGYRLIKPVLRNRFSIALYRWLHPDIGIRLARGSSRTSREYTSKKDYGEQEGMLAYAAERFREGMDIVVMGHTHEPELRTVDGGTYVNLGDWLTHRTYGMLDGGTMRLESWKDGGRSEHP